MTVRAIGPQRRDPTTTRSTSSDSRPELESRIADHRAHLGGDVELGRRLLELGLGGGTLLGPGALEFGQRRRDGTDDQRVAVVGHGGDHEGGAGRAAELDRGRFGDLRLGTAVVADRDPAQQDRLCGESSSGDRERERHVVEQLPATPPDRGALLRSGRRGSDHDQASVGALGEVRHRARHRQVRDRVQQGLRGELVAVAAQALVGLLAQRLAVGDPGRRKQGRGEHPHERQAGARGVGERRREPNRVPALVGPVRAGGDVGDRRLHQRAPCDSSCPSAQSIA